MEHVAFSSEYRVYIINNNCNFNPLNAELNPICHLLALVGAHHILHVGGIRVNLIYRYSLSVNLTLYVTV
jgi:hypothetical protein